MASGSSGVSFSSAGFAAVVWGFGVAGFGFAFAAACAAFFVRFWVRFFSSFFDTISPVSSSRKSLAVLSARASAMVDEVYRVLFLRDCRLAV